VEYAFQELDSLPPGFAPADGRTKPWGTGHAIWCARDVIDEPFAVINADDFYGGNAFIELASFLREDAQSARPSEQPARFAMVGYELQKTLSETGTVSRGLCVADANGNLASVEEITGIERTSAGGIRGVDETGNARVLNGTDPVSMNCWAFTPEIFPLLDAELIKFLASRGSDLKSEFYIPSAVAAMIDSNVANVKLLGTDATWFGVTHREDADSVRKALESLVANGNYPNMLWA
jgi:hypothetical protein